MDSARLRAAAPVSPAGLTTTVTIVVTVPSTNSPPALAVGIESYFDFRTFDTGAGSQALVNSANAAEKKTDFVMDASKSRAPLAVTASPSHWERQMLATVVKFQDYRTTPEMQHGLRTGRVMRFLR